MEERFLYRIKSIQGAVVEVEATTGEEALRAAKITDPARWYPMPIKRILTPSEKAAQDAKFRELRARMIAKKAGVSA